MADGPGLSMRLVMKAIRARFPRVQQMSTEELQKLIYDESTENLLVMLDVRETEEYHVSHIPGVIHILPSETDMMRVESLINEKAGPATCNKFVVAYCSVGYRSSALVDKLINHFESLEDHRWKATLELYNLEGSLFQWANEKRELVTCTGRKTVFAHPYNAVWGKLLDHNLRRNEPEVFDNEAMNAPQAESLVRP